MFLPINKEPLLANTDTTIHINEQTKPYQGNLLTKEQAAAALQTLVATNDADQMTPQAILECFGVDTKVQNEFSCCSAGNANGKRALALLRQCHPSKNTNMKVWDDFNKILKFKKVIKAFDHN